MKLAEALTEMTTQVKTMGDRKATPQARQAARDRIGGADESGEDDGAGDEGEDAGGAGSDGDVSEEPLDFGHLPTSPNGVGRFARAFKIWVSRSPLMGNANPVIGAIDLLNNWETYGKDIGLDYEVTPGTATWLVVVNDASRRRVRSADSAVCSRNRPPAPCCAQGFTSQPRSGSTGRTLTGA
jgi:hypothetical protein